MDIKTEWPKNEAFVESDFGDGRQGGGLGGYQTIIQNPGNMTEKTLQRLFTVAQTTLGWAFQFNGGASDQEMLMLIGLSQQGNYTTIPLKIVGKTTNAHVMYNIQLTE